MGKTKPKKIRVQVKGKQYRFVSLQAAAEFFNIPYVPFYGRIRNGWRLHKALSTPLRACKPRKYKPHPDVVAHDFFRAKTVTNTVQ